MRNLKGFFDLPLRFWIVAAIAFINAVSFTILIPILYPYAKQFGLSDFQASLLISGFAISQFLATPILGRFSDFWGRKPVLIISLLGTVAANLLASFTPIVSLLFLARILDGLTGGNNSIASAIVSDTTTPEERPKAFGLLDAAFRLGFMTGPAISYFAQSLPPFPGVSPLGMSFFVAATIAAIATGLTWVFLPETLPQRQKIRISWKIFGFGKIFTSIGRPIVGRLFLLTFFSGFTFTIFTFALQPFFLNVLGRNAKELAILFTLVGVVGVITQIFFTEPITRRFNLAAILCVTLAGRGITFLLMPLFPSLTVFLLLGVLLSAFNAFPMPLINAILSVQSSDREQGEILGINSSYLSISNAIGPAIAGILVSFSYVIPFWIAGFLTLLTAGFALSLRGLVGCQKAS
ncbi:MULTISPECIES: MFS transporter [Spirulina sp. CCY15215]|uniref:MFS transporter n=1 Tax=Spirulina sp. CCY15215 TaxID=2767591 RepID=UPI0019504E62|nr:MFS transporter [Spirulina major]